MSTYSGQSPIMGAGWLAFAAFADGGTVDRWIRAKGQALAPTYAPDHTYATPPACGQAILTPARRWNVDPVIVAAQMVKESAGGQSAIFRATNNTAGMGAENDDPAGKALHFASVADAFRAQVAHLADYAAGKGAWTPSDPRAGAMDGLFGVAPMLAGLDHRWATPGDGYGQAVADLCNDLLSFANSEGQQPMADLWPTAAELGVPYSTQMADADIGPERPISSVQWFIEHTTEGHRAGDLQILEHADPAQASVHFWVSLAGEVVGIVPINKTAWTAGNDVVSKQAIQVENEGFAKDGATEAQYVSNAAIFRWCRAQGMTVPAEYVGKQEKPGIIGHEDVADPNNAGQWGGVSHHTDPGPLFQWQHLVDLINGAPATALPNTDRIINGHVIQGGFRAYYEFLEGKLGANDALMLIGYPLSDETQDGGITVQWFERARFEWHQGARPDRWDVLLTRLGADALAAKTAKP